MLHFFRQRGLSNILYGAIIVATILTFVIEFRPTASQRTAPWNPTCVARVRGRCIDPKDFGAAYRILMSSRSAELPRSTNLKRLALDGLVERELLDDEAKRLGLSASEDEVTDQLYDGFVRISVPAEDPAVAQAVLRDIYQSYTRSGLISQEAAEAHLDDRDAAIPVDFRDPKTKVFDMKTYERQIRNISNRSASEFREGQVRELLAAKMRDLVREPIRVSDSEAWEEYDRRYSTATVTWVPVKESWAARWTADADPGAVDAWARAHRPEIDAEITRRSKDDAPKAGHVRHILVKFPYGASDEEKALALAKLSWGYARLKAGEPFAEVARDLSDDGSAVQGGDVGDKTDGFVPPFKAAADALKPGEVTSGAVETQFGYHLIAKDDPSAGSEIEARLKDWVPRSMFAKVRATDAAKSIGGRIEERLRSGASVDEAIEAAIAPYAGAGAKVEMLQVLATWPEKSEADAGAGDAGPAAAAPAGGSPLGKPKPASQAVRFDAATDADRPRAQTSTAFNRGGDPFPGLSPDGTAKVVAFAFASDPGAVLDPPVRTEDGFVVVQARERKIATRDDFEKNRGALEQELLRAKRDEALALYVRRLRDQAKDSIKIDESFVREARRADGGAESDDDEDQY